MLVVDCIRSPREGAEAARRELAGKGLLAKGAKIARDADFVYFPVEKGAKIPEKFRKLACKRDFEGFDGRRSGSLKDTLVAGGKMAAREAEAVTGAFDCIGDIAIVEIPEGLERKESEIARAVMLMNRHIRVVAKKEGPMEGVFRVRRLKIIGGEKRTETVYRESGCSFLLDVSKAYFSVRLAHERQRIGAQVGKKEKILVPFAGVGPFAIVIGKKHPDCEIVGIELNPAAAEYFGKNTEINKTKNVKAVLGDANDVVPNAYRGWADRIVMPLPHSAGDFLDAALAGANPRGCKIHFYGFVQTRDGGGKEIRDIYAPMLRLIRGKCAAKKMKCRIMNKRVVRPYAPFVVQAAVDFSVRKNA
jgi:tRNA (guanine37-N1)-methyltransferase